MTDLWTRTIRRFMISRKRIHTNKILRALPLMVLVGLLASQAIRFSLSNPLCCADDAAIADVAKSVAEGNGYALPINFDGASGRFPFNPNISTGPTLILPAAAAIAIFGADPRVPGLTKAIISIALLCWMLIEVIRRIDCSDGISYGMLLVLLVFLATSGANFVQWYALIGELVAALFIILAALFITTSDNGTRSVTIGGLCLGLAILTKLLALLALFPILLFVIYDSRVSSVFTVRWRRLGYFTLGLSLPLLLFALWQSSSLGVQGSKAWLDTLLGSVYQHIQVGDSSNVHSGHTLQRVANNILASVHSYGHSVLDTIIGVALFAMLAWTNAAVNTTVKRFTGCLALIAIANLGWWALFVVGTQWPRYELIGMIIAAACIACVQLVHVSTFGKLIGTILALFMIAPMTNPAQVVWGGLAAPTPEGQERILALRKAIEPLQYQKHSVLIGSWWASLVAPKYLLPNDVPIVAFNKLNTVGTSYHRFLLLDHRWDSFAKMDENPSFVQFRSSCDSVVVRNQYFTLLSCQSD